MVQPSYNQYTSSYNQYTYRPPLDNQDPYRAPSLAHSYLESSVNKFLSDHSMEDQTYPAMNQFSERETWQEGFNRKAYLVMVEQCSILKNQNKENLFRSPQEISVLKGRLTRIKECSTGVQVKAWYNHTMELLDVFQEQLSKDDVSSVADQFCNLNRTNLYEAPSDKHVEMDKYLDAVLKGTIHKQYICRLNIGVQNHQYKWQNVYNRKLAMVYEYFSLDVCHRGYNIDQLTELKSKLIKAKELSEGTETGAEVDAFYNQVMDKIASVEEVLREDSLLPYRRFPSTEGSFFGDAGFRDASFRDANEESKTEVPEKPKGQEKSLKQSKVFTFPSPYGSIPEIDEIVASQEAVAAHYRRKLQRTIREAKPIKFLEE